MLKKLLITTLILTPTLAQAKTPPLTDKNAILAIIGEAEGEPLEGKRALACTLRNRGTLSGVYGINAPRVKKHQYSQATYTQVSKVWQSSSNTAYCSEYLGADHWGSLKVDGAWIKKMKKAGYKHVATVGNHAFYASK